MLRYTNLEESDVDKRSIVVDELESEEFDDKSIVVSSLCPMVLPVGKNIRQLLIYLEQVKQLIEVHLYQSTSLHVLLS